MEKYVEIVKNEKGNTDNTISKSKKKRQETGSARYL